jgi:hypothetical protein
MSRAPRRASNPRERTVEPSGSIYDFRRRSELLPYPAAAEGPGPGGFNCMNKCGCGREWAASNSRRKIWRPAARGRARSEGAFIDQFLSTR